MSAKPSFAASSTGRRPQRESLRSRHLGSAEEHPALADGSEGEVGERGEVAGGPERALLGYDRQDPEADHVDESLRQLEPHARVPETEHVGAKGEHRPHFLL